MNFSNITPIQSHNESRQTSLPHRQQPQLKLLRGLIILAILSKMQRRLKQSSPPAHGKNWLRCSSHAGASVQRRSLYFLASATGPMCIPLWLRFVSSMHHCNIKPTQSRKKKNLTYLHHRYRFLQTLPRGLIALASPSKTRRLLKRSSPPARGKS